jgi:hypothetical protein
MRAWEHQVRFEPIFELTVFKFPSTWRKNSYVDKPFHQQMKYSQFIQTDTELRYRELLSLIKEPAHTANLYGFKFRLRAEMVPGFVAQQYRVLCGLENEDVLKEFTQETNYDLATLSFLTHRIDIVSLAARFWLHEQHQLPIDGLLIGRGWHEFEQNEWGLGFRWVNKDAELVITRPSGKRRKFKLDVMPGPGIDNRSFSLIIYDKNNCEIGHLEVDRNRTYVITLPVNTISSSEDYIVLRFHAEVEGHPIETDLRIMRFAISNIDWLAQEEAQTREQATKALNTGYQSEAAKLRDDSAQYHRQITELEYMVSQLDSFRTTSLRYWLHRVRTSPKLRRWLRRG